MKDKANDVLPASNGELQTDHEMPFHEIYNRCPLYVIKERAFHIIKLRLKFKKKHCDENNNRRQGTFACVLNIDIFVTSAPLKVLITATRKYNGYRPS